MKKPTPTPTPTPPAKILAVDSSPIVSYEQRGGRVAAATTIKQHIRLCIEARARAEGRSYCGQLRYMLEVEANLTPTLTKGVT